VPDGFQTAGGWIEVVAGVMFSGKSEELIRRVRRSLIAKKRVQVFKSHLDARYAGVYAVSSHDQRTVEAVPVDSARQMALRLDPAHPGALALRGTVRLQRWRRHLEPDPRAAARLLAGAEADLKRATQLAPNDAAAWSTRARSRSNAVRPGRLGGSGTSRSTSRPV